MNFLLKPLVTAGGLLVILLLLCHLLRNDGAPATGREEPGGVESEPVAATAWEIRDFTRYWASTPDGYKGPVIVFRFQDQDGHLLSLKEPNVGPVVRETGLGASWSLEGQHGFKVPLVEHPAGMIEIKEDARYRAWTSGYQPVDFRTPAIDESKDEYVVTLTLEPGPNSSPNMSHE